MTEPETTPPEATDPHTPSETPPPETPAHETPPPATPARRSWLARIGLFLLGIVGPGLALVRIGYVRTGLAIWLALSITAIAYPALYAVLPGMSFTLFAAVIVVAVVGVTTVVAAAIAALILGARITPPPRLGRWQWIVPLALFNIALQFVMPDPQHSFRLFYAASESMRPTLDTEDRIVVRLRDLPPPARGALVLYRSQGQERFGRIIGLTGDTVQLASSVVLINQTPAAYAREGAGPASMGQPTTRFRETLPGAAPHRILETREAPGDEYGPARVPAGHLFLLGDNRDNSADSRFTAEEFGAGMVPVGDVIGVPEFILWSSSRARIGERLSEPAG